MDTKFEYKGDSNGHCVDDSRNMKSGDYVKIGQDLCQAMIDHEDRMNAQKNGISTSSVDVQKMIDPSRLPAKRPEQE